MSKKQQNSRKIKEKVFSSEAEMHAQIMIDILNEVDKRTKSKGGNMLWLRMGYPQDIQVSKAGRKKRGAKMAK